MKSTLVPLTLGKYSPRLLPKNKTHPHLKCPPFTFDPINGVTVSSSCKRKPRPSRSNHGHLCTWSQSLLPCQGSTAPLSTSPALPLGLPLTEQTRLALGKANELNKCTRALPVPASPANYPSSLRTPRGDHPTHAHHLTSPSLTFAAHSCCHPPWAKAARTKTGAWWPTRGLSGFTLPHFILLWTLLTICTFWNFLLSLPILIFMILINIKQPLVNHLLIPGTALPPTLLARIYAERCCGIRIVSIFSCGSRASRSVMLRPGIQ